MKPITTILGFEFIVHFVHCSDKLQDRNANHFVLLPSEKRVYFLRVARVSYYTAHIIAKAREREREKRATDYGK